MSIFGLLEVFSFAIVGFYDFDPPALDVVHIPDFLV